jgi:F-box protein 21
LIYFRRENETTFHYAKDALVKVRISILDNKWRDFMTQPESQKSLFEGVALISQWSTMESGKGQTCLKDLEISIEKITDRVKQLLELKVGKVPCASTVEPKKNNLNILDSISHVMFIELGFKKFSMFTSDCSNYFNFQQVCLTTSLIWLKCNADEGLTLLSLFFFQSPRCFEGV